MPSFKFYTILILVTMMVIYVPTACNNLIEDTKIEGALTTIQPSAPKDKGPFDEVLKGDLDFNGIVDIADLQIMIDQQKNLAALDFDGNGKFEVKDFEALKNYLFLLKEGKK